MYQQPNQCEQLPLKINPHWSEEEWRSMLFEHLRLTEDEATYRLKGEYAKDVDIYDQIEDSALMMADMMSGGIIRQFRLQ